MSNANGVRAPSKGWLIVLLALAVAAVCVFGLLRLEDDKPAAINTVDGLPTTAATTESTTATPTPTPTKTPPVVASAPNCAKPGDLFNVAGADVDTLPPDCGTAVVPAGATEPLGLNCGGDYPTIMFKTTTAKSKTTICGTNSSGEDVRMVTEPNGGSALDMSSAYDPDLDAFVSKRDGATYVVEAYNGSLTVRKSGATDRQDSKDWLSLDNESDYD